MKENEKVHEAIKRSGMPQWKIATCGLGVSEGTLIRWLRFPLSEEKERSILDAISRLEKEVS